MDFEKLRDLVGKCRTANYQAGLNDGRAEASKEVCKSFDAELDWYLQECEAESRKPIVEVFHAEPLPPPPPTERRCRNCANFLWIPPETRETATSGSCYERNVGTEFCDAQSDLDHSWCDRWKPMEEEPKKTEAKEEQTAMPARTSGRAHRRSVGTARCIMGRNGAKPARKRSAGFRRHADSSSRRR